MRRINSHTKRINHERAAANSCWSRGRCSGRNHWNGRSVRDPCLDVRLPHGPAASARDSSADLFPSDLVHCVYPVCAIAAFRLAACIADCGGNLRGKLFRCKLGAASFHASIAQGFGSRSGVDRGAILVSGVTQIAFNRQVRQVDAKVAQKYFAASEWSGGRDAYPSTSRSKTLRLA
jgi:hypothetical protein